MIEPPLIRDGIKGDAASKIAQFVTSKSPWRFLKLGYNPKYICAKGDNQYCQAACMCKTVSDGICSMKPRRIANESC